MLDGRKNFTNVIRNRKQIGVGCDLDVHEHGGFAVEAHGHIIVFRAEGDIGDISEADNGAIH